MDPAGKKYCHFFGPAYLISVGYMDPATGQPIWPVAANSVILTVGTADEQPDGVVVAKPCRHGWVSYAGVIWPRLTGKPTRKA